MKTYAIPRSVLGEAWWKCAHQPMPAVVATSHAEAKRGAEFDHFKLGFAYGFLAHAHRSSEPAEVVFADEFAKLGARDAGGAESAIGPGTQFDPDPPGEYAP